MNATIIATNLKSEVAQLLDDLGLAIGETQVELVDFKQAETCYIHHTRTPVALAGYAMVSAAFARGRFPTFSFLDMIKKRPSMDETEACALAAICGAQVTPPFWGNPVPFGKHLWDAIERYELSAFFERTEKPYGSPGEHYFMRPRGFKWDSDWSESPEALKKWRADYKKLPAVRQLMVTTILRLYNSDETSWLVRVPKKWHAAEGIEILRDQGALIDWAKIYALYPGW